ncbi:MAG TPA: HemK/PrmC family methyltransferase [Actinomycetota bacterium]|nr:HemK/PrmC family methyltransferase [Actinomycetota bacterium]
MPTARELVRDAERRLRRSPAIDHWPADRERREAEALLAHVHERDDLDGVHTVDPARARRFAELVRRRSSGEPMAHILGWTEFHGLRLRVRPGAFVPRQSSEFTVEQAVRRLRGRRRPVHVDLATGIGPIALAVAAAVPRARVIGADISADALRQARTNARDLGLYNVEFRRGDLYGAVPGELRGAIDVVTAHVPYVPRHEVRDLPLEIRRFEPMHTLTDYSRHGMTLVERAATEGRDWLRPGGWILLEVSPDFARTVRGLVLRAGYGQVRSTKGWPGVSRVVVGRR